jgi:hypothetical protein
LERLQSITVLGGSAASSFNDDQDLSWPYLLKASLPSHIEFRVETCGGLTFVRAISELADFADEDLLILHFGTSVGWPTSVVQLGHKLGIDFTGEFAFHQPAYRSSTFTKRIKRAFKVRVRNAVKYLLFFTGRYKSRISRREIDDQIKAVVRLAKSQSKRIIWIQHQALQNRRIFLERRSYQRYYREIIESLKEYESVDFQLLTLPNEFLVQENYLLDSVHLSRRGHQELHKLVREAYKRF